jgi:hypothetical protein
MGLAKVLAQDNPKRNPHTTMKPLNSTLTLTALALGLSGPAVADVVYSHDFQSAVGAEWSHDAIASAPNPDYMGGRLFLGEFGEDDSVSLALGGLSSHTVARLSFDLYLIRSWDGLATDYGADIFSVGLVGGGSLFQASFSNGHPAGQSYGGSGLSGVFPSFTGASEAYSLGYWFDDGIRGTHEAMDAVYHLDILFAHDDSNIGLLFQGLGLQGIEDESWGLDNVSLSLYDNVRLVPEPNTGALMLFGVFGLVALFKLTRRPC